MDSAPSMESRFRLMGQHARTSRRERLFRELLHPKHIHRHGLSPFRWGQWIGWRRALRRMRRMQRRMRRGWRWWSLSREFHLWADDGFSSVRYL